MRYSLIRLTALCCVTFLAIGCQEASAPAAPSVGLPRISAALAPVAPGSGIVLDQQNGTLNESGTVLAKGFNPTNPHVGDAIIATFTWTGSTNIITSVTDFITDANHTPVGNTFRLVEYVTAGGVSMATYVATNVQGFPDPNLDPTVVYAVQANLSQSVTDGGVMVSAWRGVDAVTTSPVGAHRSGSGTGATTTVADPGAVATGVGALAYAVTLSNALVGSDPPAGYTSLNDMSDATMKLDGQVALMANGGSTDPQWVWGFNTASAWLASVLSLNPPPHQVFTAQPQTTLPLQTMPAVKVTVTDALGNVATGFTGSVAIAIGHNGGTLAPGTPSGTKTVAVVNGVATFSDLSIDQLGNGYTLVVTAGGVSGAESTPFNIGAF